MSWQPGSTLFERAADAGISAFRLAHSSLERTGLSVATMRGADDLGADTFGALVGEAAAALRRSGRVLAIVYHGELDATGHAFGCGSDGWRYHLGHVDKLAEQLASAVPPGTALHVTADHGMGAVPPAARVDPHPVPGLRAGAALLGRHPLAT